VHILLGSKNFYQQRTLYIRGLKAEQGEMRERVSHGARFLLYHCICYHKEYITILYVNVDKLLNHLKYCLTASIYFDWFLLYFMIQTISNGLKFIML
jgi:hypothetical protein